jgi:hypothetical protein
VNAGELEPTLQGFFEHGPLERHPRELLAKPEELTNLPYAPLLLLLSLESRSPEGQSGTPSVSDDDVRLAIAVEGRNPRKLIELLLEAAGKHADVLPAPAPQALLVGVSGESLSLSLRFWTAVGARHIDRLKSQLRLQVFTALKRPEIAGR